MMQYGFTHIFTSLAESIGNLFFDDISKRETNLDSDIITGNPIAIKITLDGLVSGMTDTNADEIFMSDELGLVLTEITITILRWLRETQFDTAKWAIETGVIIGNTTTIMLLPKNNNQRYRTIPNGAMMFSSGIAARVARVIDELSSECDSPLAERLNICNVTTRIFVPHNNPVDAEDYITHIYQEYQDEHVLSSGNDRDFIPIKFIKPNTNKPNEFVANNGIYLNWLDILTSESETADTPATIEENTDSNDSDYVPPDEESEGSEGSEERDGSEEYDDDSTLTITKE